MPYQTDAGEVYAISKIEICDLYSSSPRARIVVRTGMKYEGAIVWTGEQATHISAEELAIVAQAMTSGLSVYAEVKHAAYEFMILNGYIPADARPI